MTERDRFEKAWAKRPWITEDESDKDRAWRWWQAALAADTAEHKLPGHDETLASLSALTIRPQPKSPHVLKTGNLFNPVPDRVPFHGCSDKDCLPGCNLGKGHCQRLEDAFRMAGYADE